MINEANNGGFWDETERKRVNKELKMKPPIGKLLRFRQAKEFLTLSLTRKVWLTITSTFMAENRHNTIHTMTLWKVQL